MSGRFACRGPPAPRRVIAEHRTGQAYKKRSTTMDEIHMDKTEELTHPSDDPYIRGLLAPGGELEWLWDATITLTKRSTTMDEIHMDKTEELTHPSDDPYIRGLLAPGGELEWLWDATITLTIDGRVLFVDSDWGGRFSRRTLHRLPTLTAWMLPSRIRRFRTRGSLMSRRRMASDALTSSGLSRSATGVSFRMSPDVFPAFACCYASGGVRNPESRAMTRGDAHRRVKRR